MFQIRRSPQTLLIGALLLFAVAVAVRWPAISQSVLSEDAFQPHGVCYLWDPGLLAVHFSTDMLIGLSYVSISVTLAYLVHRARQDIPFRWVFLAFGTFIIACGATHFMSVLNLWNPLYWLSADVKLITAAASVGTAVILPRYIPRTLEMIQSAKLSEERQVRLQAAHHELAALYEKSKEVDELKTQFFANVSHELRTPLTLILAPTRRLIAEGGLTEDQRRDLVAIERNARTLLDHVNDLLDLATLEVGRLGVDYADLDLAGLVRETVAHFETAAVTRDLTLAVEAPEPVPAQVDPGKVRRVVLNLLSNAFKFTPAGGRVIAALRSAGDRAILTVQDNGPGVPPELRSVIFDRFRQGEAGLTRRYGGTGLGLSIVKEFVELHGGSVRLDEAPGGGARFTVEIPRLAPAGATVGAAPAIALEDPPGLKLPGPDLSPPAASAPVADGDDRPLVLVVEDNPDMRDFLQRSLAGSLRVEAAVDGQAGLERARELRPDLILTDLMMPRLSGDQIVRAVRAEPDLADTPVVLLTAKTDDALRVETLRAGAQDFLIKPFSVDELRARVENLIALKRARDVLRGALAGQSRDIAALARDLADRNRELHEAIGARDDFLSVAAHELKTPVTSLRLSAQIARREIEGRAGAPDPGRLSRLLDTIDEQSDKLARLINQLLDVSRLAAGRLYLERGPADLRPLVDAVAQAAQLRTQRHIVQVSGPAALWADVDSLRIEQVLTNLIDNAIKYSPAGGPIAIDLSRRDAATVEMAVADRGVGIPPERRAQIFERFFRAHDDDHASGLGLGLTISREILDLHGGTIGAEFPSEGGTRFVITLPAAADAPGGNRLV